MSLFNIYVFKYKDNLNGDVFFHSRFETFLLDLFFGGRRCCRGRLEAPQEEEGISRLNVS